ncbi:TRAP transporter large permease [bacterium LRH843]|nr:TRAP transporter large permease [bacterium LRH843]
MTFVILFTCFVVLLILQVPIGVSLGVSSIVTIIYTGSSSIDFLVTELVNSIDTFPLLAVPFFILAGEFMGKGGISERLFGVANSLVGHITGGFAIATIATCMFFASISGSGPATVAAIGSIMIPAMVRKGYELPFATVTVASAGALGVIIPPSIDMIMFGVTSNTSVGNMFIGGILPGIFIGLCLMIWAYIYSRKKGFTGSGVRPSLKNILKEVNNAKWALLIPLVILGGIYGGFFTPTEAGVVAVLIGFFAGVVVYRELKLKDLPRIIINAATVTGTIFFILITATTFGKLLTIEQAPVLLANFITGISENPIVIILIINAMLLFIGCFMESVAAIIILTPILFPLATSLGFDPVHFGIMMIVNLAIGLITPPLGVNLFVGSGISGLSIEKLAVAIIPYFCAMIFSLFIIIMWPGLSLFLVNILK